MAASNSARYLARHRKQIYDGIVRVDHSGELGADRIYCGQTLAIRGRDPEKSKIVQEMWNQEKEHLREFQYLLLKHRCRQSLLTPFWSIGGLVMGYTSGLLSYQAAMSLTVAVEKTITDHYNSQIRTLIDDDMEANEDLIDVVSRFRDDEQHHHDVGLENEAEKSVLHKISFVTENICKLAVRVAERI